MSIPGKKIIKFKSSSYFIPLAPKSKSEHTPTLYFIFHMFVFMLFVYKITASHKADCTVYALLITC